MALNRLTAEERGVAFSGDFIRARLSSLSNGPPHAALRAMRPLSSSTVCTLVANESPPFWITLTSARSFAMLSLKIAKFALSILDFVSIYT